MTLVAAAGIVSGCQKSVSAPPVAKAPDVREKGAVADKGPAAAKDGAAAAGETWDALYLQGTKVGYAHITTSRVVADGQPLVRTEVENRMAINRFGQTTTMTIRMVSLEKPNGDLVEFENEMTLGPTPTKTTGRVEGNRMLLTTTAGQKPQTVTIPWTAGVQGFAAAEQSLERKPMRPGETRSLKIFMPMFNQIVDVTLVAKDKESTPLLAGSQELLRVDGVMKMPDGQKIESTQWTNAEGQTLKTSGEALQQKLYRTTKAIALADPTAKALDLGLDTVVKLARPLPKGHLATKAVYRAELPHLDPAGIFATSAGQTVKSLGPHAAEITVVHVDPQHVRGPAEEPVAADRGPNNLVQSDDAEVVAMAKKAAGSVTEPWRLAQALEAYVHGAITSKNFSQAFASAAEVAKSREGDCTEHAMLLAALLRARGLPARVAIGLVYMEKTQSLGYHMWTEVNIDGHWLPLDATLGRGEIGAGHLKLASTNLKDASAFSSFLPVAQVIGRLKIELLSAD